MPPFAWAIARLQSPAKGPAGVHLKNRRQQAILHVVQTRDVRSQDQLQMILKGRGIDVTQATISRDIKEIGLIKRPFRNGKGATGLRYALASGATEAVSRLHRFISELVESIAVAGNFVVIKTAPRGALMVGSELDKAAWREVMGTIAGDDTIFILCGSKANAAKATRRLRSMKRT